MNQIMERLREASTWRGLIMLVTAFGVTVSPALSSAIVAAGVSLVSLIEIFRKEKN